MDIKPMMMMIGPKYMLQIIRKIMHLRLLNKLDDVDQL